MYKKMSNDQNVGIVNFFRHKRIFITGSTGFIGKVFIEKLLRALPAVRKVYLLVRANNAEAAVQRVKRDITDTELFKVLRQKHGESYEEFVSNKLVAVSGDICEPNMGMDVEFARVIRDEVNVILHMGASTKWNDRHDVSFEVNVMAVSRLVDFAKDCMNLVLLLQVSTVIASQNLPGVSSEKLVDFGHNCMEDVGLIEGELRIISEVALRTPKEELGEEMVKLGIRRAKFYKMHNNYQLTKAMGEILVSRLSGELPVVIFRTSLVESTFREPFPGWIEGYKALDPLVLSHGMGQLTGFVANPYTPLDVVPVDMVVNAMIAAIAKHGNIGKHGVNIYNVASGLVNPLTCHDLFSFSTDYFTLHPLRKDSNGNTTTVKNMKFYETLSEFTLIRKGSDARVESKLLRMGAIYEIVMTMGAWYDNKNTTKLLREMSSEELNIFNFDFKCINWKDYFINVHIPGIIKRVLKKKQALLTAKL